MKNIVKLDAPNVKEREWLSQKLDNFNLYVTNLVPELAGSRIDANLLDQLWMAWKETEPEDNQATADFLQAFGVAFGQLLVEESGFEWAIITDPSGSDFVVRTAPGTANTRVAPIDFVLTHYENGEDEFVWQTQQEINKIVIKDNKSNGSNHTGYSN